jgi:hypothetical protein
MKVYYLRHPYHLCTDILVIWGFMVYTLNSSFSLKPILSSMFHHPNPSNTLNTVLCKDAAKSCHENCIFFLHQPITLPKFKKMWHDKKKRSASLRCALYLYKEYFLLLYGALQSGWQHPLYTKHYGVKKTVCFKLPPIWCALNSTGKQNVAT